MNSIFKKISCGILAGILTTLCACGNKAGNSESIPQPPEETFNYTLDSYDFSTVFVDGEQKTLEVYSETTEHKDGCVVYDVFTKINNGYVGVYVSYSMYIAGEKSNHEISASATKIKG